ncbi:MAG: hypothetical protein GY749_38440 [Desulfobacteraceae bacterium]|nr:hypothetical protein [Desulfobacteraceae bacterium]
MKNNDEFLSIPQNRECVRFISQRVLSEIAPEQLEVSVGFIDPLMDMCARGEIAQVGSSDKAGGFGGTDLMIMVVVPIVVNIISNRLYDIITKKGKKEEVRAEPVEKITFVNIQQNVLVIKPSSSKKEITRMAEAINNAVGEYLESEQ